MYGIKDKLIGALGIAGYIAYFVFCIVMVVLPFIILELDFWLLALLIILLFSNEFIGCISQTILFILSFIKIMNGYEINGIFAILFWIGFANTVWGIIKVLYTAMRYLIFRIRMNRY